MPLMLALVLSFFPIPSANCQDAELFSTGIGYCYIWLMKSIMRKKINV